MINRIQDFGADIAQGVRSVTTCTADFLESVHMQNMSLAADVTSFGVGQIRMPVAVASMSEYVERSREALTDLTDSVATYQDKMFVSVRDFPQQLIDALYPESAS